MSDDPSFEIPVRPRREYSDGGVETRGETVFTLVPVADEPDVEAWVDRVLGADRYTRGDWFDLPDPVFLVHDRAIGTVFRVVVRDDRVALHVLPTTERAGLERFYERLRRISGTEWQVDCDASE